MIAVLDMQTLFNQSEMLQYYIYYLFSELTQDDLRR